MARGVEWEDPTDGAKLRISRRNGGPFARSGSLRTRMRTAQTALILLMLVPALISIVLMMRFSGQYHQVIAHMEEVSTLRPAIGALEAETMDVVAGRTRFEDGAQLDTLADAAAKLDRLIAQDPSSRLELEVSRRLLNTMEGYMLDLGGQMRVGSTVDQDMALYEEILNVSSLFLDMLQESINTELLAAAEASAQMQQVIRTAFIVEICLLMLALALAAVAQNSLFKAIQAPLQRLKVFAGRIARGELSERTARPEVEELRELAESLNTMAFKLERLIEENRREQENLKKSEMRAMQAQITPHFLYNTLDAIVWLAEDRQNESVISITQALSDFFRTSLNNGRDWIQIDQEARHLEGYLKIQKVRYRDILTYEIDIEAGIGQRRILKLVIQPLVENALYHGVKNTRGRGKITVSVREHGDGVLFTVRDTGLGMTPEALAELRRGLAGGESAGKGYGLFNVNRRLQLYYDMRDGVRIESEYRGGTSVSFVLPRQVLED